MGKDATFGAVQLGWAFSLFYKEMLLAKPLINTLINKENTVIVSVRPKMLRENTYLHNISQ